jgi:hypothetical protein
MLNVASEIKDGDKLVLTIDISKTSLEKAEPSKSGKTKMVATTRGFVKVGPVQVSLNVVVK